LPHLKAFERKFLKKSSNGGATVTDAETVTNLLANLNKPAKTKEACPNKHFHHL
jgi:hypothetical protein